jgi:hypothetical protein
MSEQPDPYGWDEWAARTPPARIGELIRDKCEMVKRARLVCLVSAEALRMYGDKPTHVQRVIADLETEGSKSDV